MRITVKMFKRPRDFYFLFRSICCDRHSGGGGSVGPKQSDLSGNDEMRSVVGFPTDIPVVFSTEFLRRTGKAMSCWR